MKAYKFALLLSVLVPLSLSAQDPQPVPAAPAQPSADQIAAEKKDREEKVVKLVNDAMRECSSLHLAENRLYLEMRSSALLWSIDEKRAREIAEDAANSLTEYINSVDESDERYLNQTQLAGQLRTEFVQSIAAHDPELALKVIRSTRNINAAIESMTSPRGDVEMQLEAMVAGLTGGKDPETAARIFRESLSRGISNSQLGVIQTISTKDHALAAKLAAELNAKLKGRDLLENYETTNTALSLLQMASRDREMVSQRQQGETPTAPLLGDADYRDLMERLIAAAAGFRPSDNSPYNNRIGNAQNIANSLNGMQAEVEKIAPGRLQTLRTSINKNAPQPDQSNFWQKYQDIIQKQPVEVAMAEIEKAPAEARDGFYQQLVWKAANSGDTARAEQIAQKISSPSSKKQALQSLKQMSMQKAASEGRFADARLAASRIENIPERIGALLQLAQQAYAKNDKTTALSIADEARALVSGRPDNESQLMLQLGIARAYASMKQPGAFEIIEPIADLLNDLSTAAQSMNGFGINYYKDGELMIRNNQFANYLDQYAAAVAQLSSIDFSRAQGEAMRMQRPEARAMVLASMAQFTAGSGGRGPMQFYRRGGRMISQSVEVVTN
jgi:hypothetical protein